MMKQILLGIFFILLFFKNGLCQVSGKVSDSRTGKPLEGVEVFIDRGTGFSNTTEEGQFELTEVVTGFVTLVLYKNGYELYHASMRIQDGRAYTLNLSLTPEKKRDLGSVRHTFQDDIQTGYRIVTYENPQLSKRKFTRFELLANADLQQQIDWEKKRAQLYYGSLRHFLAALVNGVCESEGFELSRNGEKVSSESLKSKTSLEGYYRLQLGDPVEVKYKDQSSRLMSQAALDVSEEGLLLNADLLKVEGAMNTYRLPVSYVPIAGDLDLAYEEMIKRYYEKVYVHTDKPYYYQGEPMWFKVYMNYYDRSMRDSLSKVLYVELISPDKEIVLEKMLKIDNGMTHGDFILPDTLKRGDYFLRAYTNLQRNFGDENLYVKHIPVLGITDKVDPTQANWTPIKSDWITLTTNKEKYGTRDKIEMTIEVKDEAGNPIDANLSVSVTDASQVVPIATPDITEEYLLEDLIKIPTALNYPLELGITIEGTYYDKNGKVDKTELGIVQWRSDNMTIAPTDEDGRFGVSGFSFYDSTLFFYSRLAANIETGKVLLARRIPPRWNPTDEIAKPVNLITSESQQRIFSEYEVPKDVRMLDALEIRSNKIETLDRSKRSYGIAKNVDIIKRENIKTSYGDLNYSLIGAVPGLLVQRTDGGWNIRILRATGLSSRASEPLVTIDDVPMFGRTAGEVISMIDPNTVESIEIKKSIGVLYGSQGVNGVIAVYTRPIDDVVDNSITKTATTFTAKGYDKSREFIFPDYSKSRKTDHADYRSGVYWNPNLKTNAITGSASVSFYSADLETTYKVVVEGVTAQNVPVRREYYLNIANE